MKQYDFSMTALIQVVFLILLIVLSGCARNGKFSKEATYEILQEIGKGRDATIDNTPREEMGYQEYERERKKIFEEN